MSSQNIVLFIVVFIYFRRRGALRPRKNFLSVYACLYFQTPHHCDPSFYLYLPLSLEVDLFYRYLSYFFPCTDLGWVCDFLLMTHPVSPDLHNNCVRGLVFDDLQLFDFDSAYL